MFKIIILFLSMFFLFACKDNKSEKATVNEPAKSEDTTVDGLANLVTELTKIEATLDQEIVKQLANLEATLEQATDKDSCEKALKALSQFTQAGKELETADGGMLVPPPPTGECTDTGYQEKTE